MFATASSGEPIQACNTRELNKNNHRRTLRVVYFIATATCDGTSVYSNVSGSMLLKCDLIISPLRKNTMIFFYDKKFTHLRYHSSTINRPPANLI